MNWAGRTARGWAVAAVTLAAAALAAGCSSSSPTSTPNSSAPAQSSAPTASSAPSAGGSGAKVTATETEFKIALSRNSFTAGTYNFDVKNAGKVPHALEINGPGVTNMATPMLQGGQSSNMTVKLQTGTYEIWCPVDGHRGLGMDLKIQVTG